MNPSEPILHMRMKAGCKKAAAKASVAQSFKQSNALRKHKLNVHGGNLQWDNRNGGFRSC